MTIKPIKTDSDLTAAIDRVSELFGCPEGTPESDELEVLMILVEEYENRIHPMPDAAPQTVIRERMLDLGLSPKDLVPAIGHRSTVSEVLSGKRPLTVKMIGNLSVLLRIPVAALIPSRGSARKSA